MMKHPPIDHVAPPFVNLLGYNRGEAKRATVPGVADGTPFVVRRAEGGAPPLHQGEVRDYVAEFTAFEPASSDERYVVEVPGAGVSRPFRIKDHLFQNAASRLAYQHFIDVRGHVDAGASPAHITGGGPSRDGGGQTIEAMFELMLFASNPALFERWSDELPRHDMPDVIELALWHADFCYRNHAYTGSAGGYENHIRTFGYEGQPLQSFDYQNMLDQLAAVCGAYRTMPGMAQHLTRSLFGEYRRVCLAHWEAYGRHKEVRHWVTSRKWIDEGRREFSEQGNGFGQGLLRNLFMWLCESSLGKPGRNTLFWYDIALAGDPQPQRFLEHAKDCAEDIVAHWDLENPWHLWAVRNNEHLTPQALAFFLLVAPEHAPAGARAKLEEWAAYMKRRCDNLWHYRTHSDTEWAHPKSKEVGTVAGLAGSCFLVGHVLGDAELRAIGWSQVNFVFGLNPVGRVLGSATHLRLRNGGLWAGIDPADYWPDSYPQGTGRLGGCRGTLEGSPTNGAFPFSPENYTNPAEPWYAAEGWAITNRAWLTAVAFASLGRTRVAILDEAGEQPVTSVAPGDCVTVELEAPLPHQGDRADDTAAVWTLDGGPHQHELMLHRVAPGESRFRAVVTVPFVNHGYWEVHYGAWNLTRPVRIAVTAERV